MVRLFLGSEFTTVKVKSARLRSGKNDTNEPPEWERQERTRLGKKQVLSREIEMDL